MGIVPRVAVAVTHNGTWVFQRVRVDREVVSDVFWNDVVATQLVDEFAADVAHAVRLTDHVRVLQDRLVGIKAVDTNPHVEDDVVEREFVHDVARDVNGLVGADGAGVVLAAADGARFVEEVLNRRTPRHAVAVRVVTAVVHVVAALVQEVVCTKHVQREEVGVNGVDVDEFALPRAKRLTQVVVKLELVVAQKAVVRNVVVGAHVGDRAVRRVNLFDVRVGGQTRQRPQPNWPQ